MNEIFVKSHIARDLLQTAGLFASTGRLCLEVKARACSTSLP